jgi:phage tail tape-measure protein
VAAPVFSRALLALDDQEHTATDYAAKGIRAAIPGAIAGALASAASGAVLGSAVPGLGTAVGFVVGFVGYYVVDELIGDEVEEGVRHILK